MENKGKVLGFVGPMGGGKTYQLESAKTLSNTEGRIFITGDFSDGIRASVLKIFGVEGAVLEPSDENYLEWKRLNTRVSLPTNEMYLEEFSVCNRDLLKNVGEYFKKLAGADVWARWTENDVHRKYYNLPELEREKSNVAFGSIRFAVEANVVFNIANITGKELKILFCNYNQTKFNSNVHISESLAHQLIFKGYKHGDDVTEVIKEIYKL